MAPSGSPHSPGEPLRVGAFPPEPALREAEWFVFRLFFFNPQEEKRFKNHFKLKKLLYIKTKLLQLVSSSNEAFCCLSFCM